MKCKVKAGICPIHSYSNLTDYRDEFVPYDAQYGWPTSSVAEVAIHEDYKCIRCLCARPQTRVVVPLEDFLKYQERKYGRKKNVA